ncbi:MAG: hypothetical protein EOP56_03935 [Sphingobacteriales bacterium]|nr:MAG: hypothetical protein EOP56_03935 [Sphingobacteriales bacterium]
MLDFVNKWKHKIAHYIDVRLQLMKLSIIERVSNVLSYFIFAFITLFLGVAILVFLGISIGEALSSLVDSRALGYLMTTGIYVLLFVVLILCRTAITNKFAGVFITMLTHIDDEEKDDKDEHHNNPA